MSITIALAGNPNSGKTTLFNALTGANQYVGNWPGVTVEKKEGKLKGEKDVTIADLPGIYSLSPYTLEEVVARNYLLGSSTDAILNIVDGTNLERNLYLTTQLIELGYPMVIAVNMIDIVQKRGDTIDLKALSENLGCPVVEISALKGKGVIEAAKLAKEIAISKKCAKRVHSFESSVENAIDEISGKLNNVEESKKRFIAVKYFERDDKIDNLTGLNIDVESIISKIEEAMDDDSESIIANERYNYITSIIDKCITRKAKGELTTSDKIDKIVTNRFLALPIFAAIMYFVYYMSVSWIGGILTDWTNETLFEETIIPAAGKFMESLGTSDIISGLVVDGIVGGVGAVLGFVPQMFVLFFLLAILEGCGYMARVAFIMDRIFRKFGLSGKSFIPMIVASGCGVPGVMASRTIENDRDRKMTIMTTTFVPCGAKLPIIALIAGALFRDAAWVGPFSYFIGIGAIIVSGIILKKMKIFAGDPAPFVMELPAYHVPTAGMVLRSMWERGWSFIKKAGTVIVLAAIVIWFFSSYGIVDGNFTAVENMDQSFMADIGKAIGWIFAPLGFGHWKAAVATINGLVAKEVVVGTFGILYGFGEVAENGKEFWGQLAADFTTWAGLSFLVFNLLCAPCFAAMGAIKREMNNAKWTWIAIGYETGFAYVIALIIYQLGIFFTGGGFTVWTGIAFALVAALIYLLVRPYKASERLVIDSRIEKKLGKESAR